MIDKDFEMATEKRSPYLLEGGYWFPVNGGRINQVPERQGFHEAKLEDDSLFKMMQAIDQIPEHRRVTHKTIEYGQLLHAAMPGGGFSPACKVHFFNTRGVLIGNLYEFVDYTRLKLHDKGVVWERIAYGKKYEGLRQWTYIKLCLVITKLLKITQRLSL